MNLNKIMCAMYLVPPSFQFEFPRRIHFLLAGKKYMYVLYIFLLCLYEYIWRRQWYLNLKHPSFSFADFDKIFYPERLTAQGIFGSVPMLLLLLKQPVRGCVWLVFSVNTLPEEVTG